MSEKSSTMKRMIKYIWSMALVLQVICSCSKDSAEHRPADPLDGVTFNADGSLNLPVNLEIPGMMPASTRALDGTPAYDGLSLYLLVFDEDGLKQLVHLDPAEQESGQTDDKHGHESMVTTLKSTVRLEPTEKKAVVLADYAPGRWLDAINATMAYYDEFTQEGTMARLYYGSGLTIKAVAEKMDCTERTIHYYRDAFVMRCALFAAERGLIKLSGGERHE